MPTATRNDVDLASGFNETQVIETLLTQFRAAGFPNPFDYQPASSTGTNRYIVYEFINDATKTKGRVYLRIRWVINATTGAITFYSQLLDSWNLGTKTGTNGGTEITCNLVVSMTPVPLETVAINHPEVRGVWLRQGTTLGWLVFIKPLNLITWDGVPLLDQNRQAVGYIPAATDANTVYSTADTSGSTDITGTWYVATNSSLANKSVSLNRYSIEPAPSVYPSSATGAFLRFSNDIATTASSGLTVFTFFSGTGYTLIFPRSNSGLAILLPAKI
jgi:hypothetical protein